METNKYFFTKEEYDALYEAQIHFINVRTNNCIKNCPRWLCDQVANVWENKTGEKVQRNWSCNSCVFNFFNIVGKHYMADMKLYEKEEKEKEEEKVEVFTESVTFNVSEQPQIIEQPKEPKPEIVVRRGRKPKKQTE